MDGKEKTTAILNALQKHKVPNATFFLTMQNISSKDDLARLKQYDDAGYKLAHHSFSHMSASKNKFEQYKNDFIKADKMLSSLGLNNIIGCSFILGGVLLSQLAPIYEKNYK